MSHTEEQYKALKNHVAEFEEHKRHQNMIIHQLTLERDTLLKRVKIQDNISKNSIASAAYYRTDVMSQIHRVFGYKPYKNMEEMIDYIVWGMEGRVEDVYEQKMEEAEKATNEEVRAFIKREAKSPGSIFPPLPTADASKPQTLGSPVIE